jgi:hypothetical protein
MQQGTQLQSPARNRGGLLSPSQPPAPAQPQPQPQPAALEDEAFTEEAATEEEEAIFKAYYTPMKAMLYQENAFQPLIESLTGGGRTRFAQAMSAALNAVYEQVSKSQGPIPNVEVLFYIALELIEELAMDVEQASGEEVDDRAIAAALTQTLKDWAGANLHELSPEDQATVEEALQSADGQQMMGMMQQGQVGQVGQQAANAPQAPQGPQPQQGGMIR